MRSPLSSESSKYEEKESTTSVAFEEEKIKAKVPATSADVRRKMTLSPGPKKALKEPAQANGNISRVLFPASNGANKSGKNSKTKRTGNPPKSVARTGKDGKRSSSTNEDGVDDMSWIESEDTEDNDEEDDSDYKPSGSGPRRSSRRVRKPVTAPAPSPSTLKSRQKAASSPLPSPLSPINPRRGTEVQLVRCSCCRSQKEIIGKYKTCDECRVRIKSRAGYKGRRLALPLMTPSSMTPTRSSTPARKASTSKRKSAASAQAGTDDEDESGTSTTSSAASTPATRRKASVKRQKTKTPAVTTTPKVKSASVKGKGKGKAALSQNRQNSTNTKRKASQEAMVDGSDEEGEMSEPFVPLKKAGGSRRSSSKKKASKKVKGRSQVDNDTDSDGDEEYTPETPKKGASRYASRSKSKASAKKAQSNRGQPKAKKGQPKKGRKTSGKARQNKRTVTVATRTSGRGTLDLDDVGDVSMDQDESIADDVLVADSGERVDLGASVDIWSEDPRDIRHESSSRTGIYVVNPVVNAPPGYDKSIFQSGGFYRSFDCESLACVKQRREAFEEAASYVENAVSNIILESNSKVYAQIRKFIQSTPLPSASCFGADQSPSDAPNTGSGKEDAGDILDASAAVPVVKRLLPCCVLFAGLNVADHQMHFQQMCNYLSGEGEDHAENREDRPLMTVTLKALDLPSPDAAVKTVVERFLSNSSGGPGEARGVSRTRSRQTSFLTTYHNLYMSSEGKKGKQKSKMDAKLQFPLQALTTWYEERTARRKDEGEAPERLVVVLQELEMMQPETVSRLLHALSSIASTLPIVLLLGVATDSSALHSSVLRQESSRIDLSLFHIEGSRSMMEQVFERIILGDNCPVIFGPRTITFLSSYGEQTDGSLREFLKVMRLALLEHFDAQGLSQLAVALAKDSFQESDVSEILEEGHLEFIASLPSVSRVLQRGQRKGEQGELTVRKLFLWLRFIKHHRSMYAKRLDLFYRTVEKLVPNSVVLTRQFVYNKFLSATQTLDDLSIVKDLFACIGSLPLEDCSAILTLWMGYIDELTPPDKAAGVKMELEALLSDVAAALLDSRAEASISTTNSTGKKAKSAKQRRDAIHQVANQSIEAANELRSRMEKFFNTLCVQKLVPYTRFPLYELLYSNRAASLERLINVDSRATLQRALQRPEYYLGGHGQVEAKKGVMSPARRRDDTVSRSEEDTCLLYVLSIFFSLLFFLSPNSMLIVLCVCVFHLLWLFFIRTVSSL